MNRKPVNIELKYGIIIGILIILSTFIGLVAQWKDLTDFLIPKGNFLNWNIFIVFILLTNTITWFLVNSLWNREYNTHEFTKKERDNLKELLKISENERLTDVVTGIPNSRRLEKDIEEYSMSKNTRQLQFILIDLKDFRKVNNAFGYIKTNNLLRAIAQSIYKKMRRNEDMYKYSIDNSKNKDQEGFYRVYPGGDEFAFIIDGDQADAIGFATRLVSQFKEISKMTGQILGKEIDLSFHCAILEMDARDTYDDVFGKAEECYRISKEGNSNFTICWHPNSKQEILSKDIKKKNDYSRAYEVFEVMTMKEPNL